MTSTVLKTSDETRFLSSSLQKSSRSSILSRRIALHQANTKGRRRSGREWNQEVKLGSDFATSAKLLWNLDASMMIFGTLTTILIAPRHAIESAIADSVE